MPRVVITTAETHYLDLGGYDITGVRIPEQSMKYLEEREKSSHV